MVAISLPLVIGRRYELQRLFARGGGSGVYVAVDLETQTEVAVKVSDPGDARATQRFEREASALALIGSEHVVRVLGVGFSHEVGTPYLIMELLVGDDLQKELKRRGPLAADDVLRWFHETAGAVELAHGVGIVHRDLKPGNLFLHQPPHGERIVKVLDFGLVKRLDFEHSLDQDVYAGTPHFMAPEQVRGHAARIGPPADIWALGMVAVSMLTGVPYWNVSTADEALAAIISHPITPPSARWPWLPEGFDAWFRRSCDRVAERRFPSALAQAAALTQALATLTVEGTRPDGSQTLQGGPATAPRVRPLEPTATFFGSHTSRIDDGLRTLDIVAEPGSDRPLIGRDAERHDLAARLAGGPGILITVTGAGGSGKTRLATEVAHSVADSFPGGVFIVNLGALRDPGRVAEAMADVLVPKRDAVLPLADHMAAALRDRRALIVLDNFEHLRAAKDVIAELRRRAPEVAWLITSRTPVGLPDEERFPLAPLEVPPGKPSAAEAANYSSVQLFVERARAAAPGFRLSDDNVAAICETVRRLDGLPLALELAAARVRRLEERRVPGRTPGPGKDQLGDVAEQQRTMRAAIAWSYDLLTDEERLVFRRIAVCPGGVTPSGARRLVDGDVEGVEAILTALCDSSLVQLSAEEPPRYRLLETVREFGLEALAQAGEERVARSGVLDHALAISEEAQAGLRGPDQGHWLAVVAAELDNLRAALGWALADAPADALTLAAGLSWFWYLRGHYREGSAWLEAALARSPTAAPETRAPALLGAGELAFLQCHYGRAISLLEESAELARRHGDRRGSAAAEQRLGSVAREQGEYAACAARHERSRAAWVRIGDRREEARSLNYLAFVSWLSGGDATRAATLAREAREVFNEIGDKEGLVWSTMNLGAIDFYRGEVAAAVKRFEEAFHHAVSMRFQEGIAWSLNMQALCSMARREWTRAVAQLRASLNLHRKLGDLWRSASVLEALAVVAAETGLPERAAVIIGSARALRRRIGAPVPACERPLLEGELERLRQSLGSQLDLRLAEGEVLPLDEALDVALEDEPETRAAG